MGKQQRLQEMEFELALTGTLEDIYDLDVRMDKDPLNRRANGYATLSCDYHTAVSDPDEVKIVVSIEGVKGSSFAFRADFSNSESIVDSAEQCEALAMAVQAHLDGPAGCEPDVPLGRRVDD